MQLTKLFKILEDYQPAYFIKPSRIFEFNQKKILSDIENEFAESIKQYLSALSDLDKNKISYSRNNTLSLITWLSKIIEAIGALRELVNSCEEMANVFTNETHWMETLSVEGIIEILDVTNQELNILRNQARSSRQYNRIRETAYFMVSQRFLHILRILSTALAVKKGVVPSSEMVSVIGRGLNNLEIC